MLSEYGFKVIDAYNMFKGHISNIYTGSMQCNPISIDEYATPSLLFFVDLVP